MCRLQGNLQQCCDLPEIFLVSKTSSILTPKKTTLLLISFCLIPLSHIGFNILAFMFRLNLTFKEPNRIVSHHFLSTPNPNFKKS